MYALWVVGWNRWNEHSKVRSVHEGSPHHTPLVYMREALIIHEVRHLCMEFHPMCMCSGCVACLLPLDIPLVMTSPFHMADIDRYGSHYRSLLYRLGWKFCGICNGVYGQEGPWGALKIWKNKVGGWMHHIPTCEACTHFCRNSHRFEYAHYDKYHCPVSEFFWGCPGDDRKTCFSKKKSAPHKAPVMKPY